ncbi:MAG: DUF2752 domain-containing protein [Lachnospiraceae bacterium]|nr:DUF2752 domain-containing protein [Lachnospiraceae bacterium]MDD6505411.1 DUF2752 domain-containing protein [Lachnospiraceae bacterium]
MRSKKFATFLLLMISGIAYAGFVSVTGYGVPCLFRLVTGWKCPGCGITHMLVELLRGDIRAAFFCNPVLACILPYVGFRLIFEKKRWKWFSVADACCVVILLLWGVVRNIM